MFIHTCIDTYIHIYVIIIITSCSECVCKSQAAFKTAALIEHHPSLRALRQITPGKKAAPDGLTRQITHPAPAKPWLRNSVNYPQLLPLTREKKRRREREKDKKKSVISFLWAP